jgi:hypothetical protein
MAKLTIATEDNAHKFAVGNPVKLVAKAEGTASGYQWQRACVDVPGATSDQYEFVMSEEAAKDYVVKATVDGVAATSDAFSVDVAAAPVDPLPVWHVWFAVAVAAAGVLLALGLVARMNLLNGMAGFAEKDWSKFAANLKLAAFMALPLTIIGSLAVLVGLGMALVEWRGRFAEKPTGDKITVTGITGEDAAKVIEAVGKLRGAALSMVVGAIVLIASAWIAQSAAGTAPGSAEPTSSTAASTASVGVSASEAPQ